MKRNKIILWTLICPYGRILYTAGKRQWIVDYKQSSGLKGKIVKLEGFYGK